MLVLHNHSKPYLIESLSTPLGIKHCWMFNGAITDYVLAPIQYLEETSGPALKVRINSFDFWIPESWNILVTDTETYQLDNVDIGKCASVGFDAVAFSPSEFKLRTLNVQVLDYSSNKAVVHPMISKGSALVHAIGPTPLYGRNEEIQLCVTIGPHDLYPKYLAGKVVGDLFEYR